jgi:transaldolase
MTRLSQLSAFGQSIWIDWLSRDLLESGGLADLIAQRAVVGVTTNPTILERALLTSRAYDDQLRQLNAAGIDPARAFNEVAATDVRRAALQLLPVWRATAGRDGYVSWEVDPRLAWDSAATSIEVRRLQEQIDLPNLLVKIPGTEAGLQAIEDSIAAGYSINVTLLFSLERYAAVTEAYLRGLRRAADAGLDLSQIHSVASFFISRLDTAADALLAKRRWHRDRHGALRGRLGIASAKVAYRLFQFTFAGPRWHALRAEGATPQRLLWASTSTKAEEYSDVRYVEHLIGADTVTTLTEDTLYAFADHGEVGETLIRGVEEAERTLHAIADAGIDLQALTDQLERDGIEQFTRSLEAVIELIASLEKNVLAA